MIGKLVVIDGIDGSGKTTQIELLAKYLTKKDIPYEVVNFPQYGKNEYADKVHDYLSGKLGNLDEVDPYFIAKLYAQDRKTVRDLIKSWLKSGKLVVANRYISANKAHIGANLPKEKREQFFKWLDELEYQTNGMPKEDLTILLKVDPKIGQKNVIGKHRPDIHERSLNHLEQASKIYLQLASISSNWYVVNCMRNGGMKTPQEIHQEIIKILEKYIHEN